MQTLIKKDTSGVEKMTSSHSLAHSLTLEEPFRRLHKILLVSVIESERLQRLQGQASIDNTIIIGQHFEQSRVHKSLRESSTFQMDIDNRTVRAVVMDCSCEFWRFTKSHLFLLHRWTIFAALSSTT